MALEADAEILQDFLMEAGEILEQLGEQLVQLEHRPDDKELLNAVFRGFHTVKGGGSFLSLSSIVAICHRAEDVFNILRTGQRQVDAKLMDVILPVLDVLNAQFKQLRSGQEPSPAPPDLLEALEFFSTPAAIPHNPGLASLGHALPAASPIKSAPAPQKDPQGDITDDEFEQLLDALHPASAMAIPAPSVTVPPGPVESGEITEEEFEALLDGLQGKVKPLVGAVHAPAPVAVPAESEGEITEAEFDALLDQLHGAEKPGQSGRAPAPSLRAVERAQPVKLGVRSAPEDPEEKEDAEEKGAPAQKKADSKEPSNADTTVRVDTKRLDEIMNLVGELVLVRNRLSTLEAGRADEEMAKVVSNLDVVTADLQAAVMKTRMQPIKKVFGRFPRVVRDLARSLKKEVNLELHGEETDLDKNLVEALADPLVHLVRNAVDHGIEAPEQRARAGKPRAGRVVLSARQEGDHILLTIEDDGGGMDPEVLRRKAVEKGVLDAEAAARLDERECFNLIFLPGFSTKEQISDVSGRGVGMDVVKTRISQLNGVVEILSELGKGTTLNIKVPLTLAIMPTLMVMIKTQIFALPLVNVNEILHLDLQLTNVIDGQLVIMVREKALPLFYLRRWLVQAAYGDTLPELGHVVVVTVGAQKVGFIVDHLIGQEEVVIKPLGAMLHGTKGLSGATITGDGRIALILDVPELMSSYGRRG